MTQAEKKETKEKIIEQARELFATHGFKGTSIRKIADASNVNIAAINYHFGSKENLYWWVLEEAYETMERGTKETTSQSETIEELAQNLFRYMREQQHYVVSTMKTFLSDQVPAPESNHPYAKRLQNPRVGPPGGLYIADFVATKYPDATEEAVQWVVMCLFSSIFHFATISCCAQYENIKKDILPVEKIEKNLMTLSTALINHLEYVK